MSTVIDANCMKSFQDERVREQPARYTRMIEVAMDHGHIAIDDEGKALQEYNDCCRPSAVGLNLCDWIADQIVNRVILMFSMDRGAEKDLKRMGVPGKDLKWPAIAIGSAAGAIVTDDIDLFDPKAKSRKSKEKEKIRKNGGCVSIYLRKNYRILVSTAENFVEE